MTVADDLRQCGLDVAGDPPVVSVQVAGNAVAVHVEDAAGVVNLRAELPMSVPSGMATLDNAALGAAGDTAFAVSGGLLVGTRRLAQPALGACYDAIFELAKATCSVSRLLADTAALAAPMPATEAVPAVVAPSAVVAPAPAPSPTPAAAPVSVAAPPPSSGEFWFFVEADQPLMSGGQGSQVLGTLRPGVWYLAVRQDGDWVKALDDRGTQGWVRVGAVRRDQ